MKKLVMVRHAKSDWGIEGLFDIDRPLNERGYTDAYEMAALYFAALGKPDLLISSPSTRTLSTAGIFTRVFGIPMSQLEISNSLYEANEKVLLQTVQRFKDNVETIMVFGHNPGFTNFINATTTSRLNNVPTAGIVVIEFYVDSWSEIENRKGEITFNAFPKEFL